MKTVIARSARISSVLSLALLAMIGLQSSAHADKCKNPDLRIKNKTSEKIRIINFQYFDGCEKKWRVENVKNKMIAPGDSAHFGDDLEYVEGCTVPKLIVNYEVDYANDFKAGIKDAKEIKVEKRKDGELPKCVTGSNLVYALQD
jgi:hypothetical protein